MAEQSGQDAIAVVEKPQESLENTILRSEKALGLETEYDRQTEASLFIDKKFLSYALITGVVQRSERVFGGKAWADYLDGRLFARQYGKQDLTPDFIRELHAKLTYRSDPEISGKIREFGVIGASYDECGKPVTYTKEQVSAIERNPQLSFKRIPPEDANSTTGFIVYPPQSGAQIKETITENLNKLCEWFNKAKKEKTYSPHAIAGLLQHRLVSIHPFSDGNGRLTRTLMNWSLENDGEAPSVIDNPGEDILTDEETWVSYITKGSDQYKAIKKRQSELQEAGIHNINALFDLGQDKAFYEYIFQHLKQAPSLPTNGDKHKHQTYEDFLADFKAEMNRFQEYLSSVSKLKSADGEKEIMQGGLITPEFMDFASASNMQVLPLEIRKQFFADTKIYRGGIVEGNVDDEEICKMFQDYSGVGTGYRSLQRSHLPATSLNNVNPQVIRESMEYYNKMFASSYLQKKHPDIKNPYTATYPPIGDLNKTISEHTAGGDSIWNSPFASTSLNYSQGHSWATRFSAGYAKDAQHGVLFRAQLPREGMVMTFGQKFEGLIASGFAFEYEALVAGGLQPASITGIDVYDRGSIHRNPGLSARRVEEDGKVNVVIENRRGEFVITKTYTYNPDATRFEFAGEVATEISSATPIEKPPAFDSYDHKDFSHFFADEFKKGYNSPFKSMEIYPILEKYNFSEFNEKFTKDYPFSKINDSKSNKINFSNLYYPIKNNYLKEGKNIIKTSKYIIDLKKDKFKDNK